MLKKIIIISSILVVLTIVVIALIPWGEYESNIEKSELEEAIQYSNDTTVTSAISLDSLEGFYYVKPGKEAAAEILFSTDGLKTTKGAFTDFEISFEVADDFKASELTVKIQTASINTGNTMRDEHLLEEDFFDAKKFPSITYVSNNIVLGDTSYVAKGDLTLNGTTKALDVPFLHLGAGGEGTDRFEAFEGAFEFDRTLYGQEESSGVGNVVKVNFYCELKKK